MDLSRMNELGFEKGSKFMSLIVTLSQSVWWNVYIALQCYVVCILCTFELAFANYEGYIIILRYAIDVQYVIDIICALVNRRSPRFRNLRYSEARQWYFIVMDIISVIPFELVYTIHYVAEHKNSTFQSYLIQNRLLRAYRVFLLESFCLITVCKASQYSLFLILNFTSKVVLVAHLMCCIWVNLEKSFTCDEKSYNCFIFYEKNMAILVILNWSGPVEMFRKPLERLVVLSTVLIGFFLIFAHFYPYTLYVSMELNFKRALYYDKYGKLQCFLKNMVQSSELKEKVLGYFNDVWQRDTGNTNLKALVKNIPLALKKEIFTDIYWEAFRHSELLRDVSRSCKRSLSLYMTTTYYQAGEVVYYKGQEKLKMMFLVQGIIQIMAEENEESPVLSFSRGTIFGEWSLFFFCRSQALVKCKSYCELQILTVQAVTQALRGYPKDRKLINRNLHRRLTMARYTQWRKQKFRLEILNNDFTFTAVEDCVKWIKSQWTAMWEGHKRHLLLIKAKKTRTSLPSWQAATKPDIKVEFISNYLDLIVLSDVFEEKKDVVCLRTAFPWSIDPSANFLKIWNILILVAAPIPGLVYPICTAWLLKFPWTVYILSYIITGMFQVDVILKFLTAIKTKHLIITQFWAVFRQRLQQPTFYLDVIAALPYQLYLLLRVDVRSAESYVVGLVLHPAILKFHLIFLLKVPLGDYMEKITLFKNCLIYFLLVYWFAEIIQLFWIRNISNEGFKDWVDWFHMKGTNLEKLMESLSPVFRTLVMAISIPYYNYYHNNNISLVCFFCAKYLFFLFFCFFFGDFYSEYNVKIFSQESFQVLLNRIKKYISSTYIPSETANRLLKSVVFQWDYDHADHLSNEISITEAIPRDLKQKIYSATTYKTLKSCQMFEDESSDFIIDVMESSSLVAVPSGSLMVPYGQVSHTVSIIHQGHCQINSFFANDITAGLGFPILAGRGTMFPMLSSFCNVPAPISVVTVTDCEIIMINLEDLLGLMIKYELFKDIIDVVKEKNIREALIDKVRPGLMRVRLSDTPKEDRKRIYRDSYRKYGRCGTCLYFCCPRKGFSLHFVRNTEILYLVFLMILCVVWPCCFGLLIYSSHILIPFITVVLIICITSHLFLHFYTPYYNKLGILVTHPLYTSINYLTSSFFFDFVCVFPLYPIYLYFIADPYKKANVWMVLINFAQHYLKLIQTLGLINNTDLLVISGHDIRIFKIFLILFLTFNFLVNLSMYLVANWIFDGPYKIVGFEIPEKYRPDNPNLITNNSITDYYLCICHWTLCNLMTTDYLLNSPRENQMIMGYAQSFVGTVLNFYLYVWISSNSMFKSIGGMIYQEKVTSFIKYLEFEKADDKLIEYAISFYNHEWSHTKGENLEKVFEHLPLHLHEELVYSLYKPTFVKNKLLAHANDGFYKSLAVQVTYVYFSRGSVITFQYESQSDIYFLHKGKCFVYDWFLILDVGSIVGDINRTGLMVNKVYALTNVEMLKISSTMFFNIINNFGDLEAGFLYGTKNAENFVKSEAQTVGYQLRPVDSRDVLNAFGLQKKDIGFEDGSYFEDSENSSLHLLKTRKSKPEAKTWFLIIYPGTWKIKVFTTFVIAISFFTVIGIPTLMSFGSLTAMAFIYVGTLDVLWFFILLLYFRVAYLDETNGDVITDMRFIAKKRLKELLFDVVSVIPFELIYILTVSDMSEVDSTVVCWLRMIRILRMNAFMKSLKSRELNTNHYLKLFHILLYFIIWFFCLTNIYIAIATEPTIVAARNPHKLGPDQFFAFVFAFEYVMNFVASSNLCVIIPDTITQILYFNFNVILSSYYKGWIIGQVLSVLYVKGLATSYYKSQVVALESYLKNQDTSPSIVQQALNYKMNLLLYSRSENMPSFLRKAPPSLRIRVMKDLYMQHLLNCPLFQDANRIFLDQLVARMKREIYFPGQLIVEQYDVDHSIYFIHYGEVYVMNQTKDRAYVEYVVGRMYKGEYFGEAQGLWFSLPHVYTYRARTLVEFVILRSDDWLDLRRTFPEAAREILNKAKALRII